MMMMRSKGKRLIPITKPVHLKLGVALAISVSGILYTYCRIKRIKPSNTQPSSLISPDYKANSRGENDDHNDINDRHDLQSTSNCTEDDKHKSDLQSLRSKIKILEEKKKNLEIRLLEYYGLKEQETTIMELQNRLRLNNMECKLYNLKIKSLQSDNERLESQSADYAKVVYELEAAKAKIKLLKKKLRLEAEHNRETILTLQERVMKMQTIDEDIVMKLQERNELKEELEEMRKSNKLLETVNSNLAQELDCVQKLAKSTLNNEEVELLKQRNEDLKKEIEQLQADHRKDMEVLVYLRWVNACFRHKMRKSLPDPSKTASGDVSKKLSPTLEGIIISGSDFGSDNRSPSQASSCLTDSSGNDDSLSVDINKRTNNICKKMKVFTKFKKLFSGKRASFRESNAPLERAASVDDIVGKYSSGGSSRRSFDSRRQDSIISSRRTSDIEDDSSDVFSRIGLLSEDDIIGWSSNTTQLPREGAKDDAKIELALKCKRHLK